MGIKKAKAALKGAWEFVWNDNSVWSWIVNIILAFVIIKFIVYPGLGFALQTSHPIVAVVSGSMEHRAVHPCIARDGDNPLYCLKEDKASYEICGKVFSSRQSVGLDFFWDTCGAWYIEHNITKSDFQGMGFRSGFNKGDIMVLYGTKPEDILVGDIIVFTGYMSEPIIHRVVKVTNYGDKYSFQTKGDHNSVSYSFEQDISEEQYIGRAVARVPWLGYVKIFAVDFVNKVLR